MYAPESVESADTETGECKLVVFLSNKPTCLPIAQHWETPVLLDTIRLNF